MHGIVLQRNLAKGLLPPQRAKRMLGEILTVHSGRIKDACGRAIHPLPPPLGSWGRRAGAIFLREQSVPNPRAPLVDIRCGGGEPANSPTTKDHRRDLTCDFGPPLPTLGSGTGRRPELGHGAEHGNDRYCSPAGRIAADENR